MSTDDEILNNDKTDLIWSDEDQSDVYSEWSVNAIEVTEMSNVEWVQQPDGSYCPWEWFTQVNGEQNCFSCLHSRTK